MNNPVIPSAPSADGELRWAVCDACFNSSIQLSIILAHVILYAAGIGKSTHLCGEHQEE